MSRSHSYPQDLARLVRRQLDPEARVSEQQLTDLFAAMYFASLRTEEAEPVRCTLTYVDPVTPDPSPPDRIVADRWSYIRFDQQLPLDVSTLAKVAKAVDPAASSLAVYADAVGRLFIWGMIDQSLRFTTLMRRAAQPGPERPGEFQATITGVGSIAVYRGYGLIGSLKHDALIRDFHDVLRRGPVQELLAGHIGDYIQRVQMGVAGKGYAKEDYWDEHLTELWLGVLCRILLEVQRFQHGGGILMAPFPTLDHLKAKYLISYGRLRQALQAYGERQIIKAAIEDQVFRNYLEQLKDDVPMQLYLDNLVFGLELDESLDEIAGCIRYISSLSRVDGVVLLQSDLTVRGFGVEISLTEDVAEVFLAGDSEARQDGLRRVDFNHFGTRHRSMMRYCFHHEGSVGFVISQDGDIRAMAALGGRLVLWENIKVQYLESHRKLDAG